MFKNHDARDDDDDAPSPSRRELFPPGDVRNSDAEVTEGTHPVAMLGAVLGIASILTGGCFCLVPMLAPFLQGSTGLAAIVLGSMTLVRIKQARWGPSNALQAKLALGFGTAGVIFAVCWGVMLSVYGRMPFVPGGGGPVG